MPELYGRPPKKTRPRRDAANVTPEPVRCQPARRALAGGQGVPAGYSLHISRVISANASWLACSSWLAWVSSHRQRSTRSCSV